jgi:hypothetical protein
VIEPLSATRLVWCSLSGALAPDLREERGPGGGQAVGVVRRSVANLVASMTRNVRSVCNRTFSRLRTRIGNNAQVFDRPNPRSTVVRFFTGVFQRSVDLGISVWRRPALTQVDAGV